ncbi:MAG: hypothetical protein PHX72_01765 [Candidatus Shapirobacteria bacterium]|nr:hypothetical protein [Candidatus Shapirobacteria bacterium]
MEFYRLRRGFTENPQEADLSRNKIAEFNLRYANQIPEEGFLPGLYRTISNHHPDPKSLTKK